MRSCVAREVFQWTRAYSPQPGVTVADPKLMPRSYINSEVTVVLVYHFSSQSSSSQLLPSLSMQFLTTSLFAFASVAVLVGASPTPSQGPTPIDRRPTHIDARAINGTRVVKREVSFGNPDRVADQGDRYQINYGSTSGHENACDGHYICCMSACLISHAARTDLLQLKPA